MKRMVLILVAMASAVLLATGVALGQSIAPDTRHPRVIVVKPAGDELRDHWHPRGRKLAGIPPTGKRVELPDMGINYFFDRKLGEPWEFYDVIGMRQQLGVIPYPE